MSDNSANVYDNLPPLVFEDDRWRYVSGKTGHLIRLRRKTCFSCSKSAVFVVILNYKKHNKVVHCYSEHASAFGQVPPIPDPIQPQHIKEYKEKIPTTEVIRKWNMQVKI